MIRYIQAIPARSARGLVKEVYGRIRTEFGTLGEPLTLHSPLPDLLAGLWCALRESMLAGIACRAVKETVAIRVSRLNDCAYCVDAHAVMLRAANAHDVTVRIRGGNEDLIRDPRLRAAAAWAGATRSPGSSILATPPFSPPEAPEIIGTAVWIHYINRMSTVLLGENLIPVRSDALGFRSLAERAGALVFARRVRKRYQAGESLEIIREAHPCPEDIRWASASAPVMRSFAAFSDAVERAGSAALDPAVRRWVLQNIRAWNGSNPGIGRSWVEPLVRELPHDHRPEARLALLTSLAPHQVGDDVVGDYRARRSGDESLLGALAWSSFAAARRIGSWLAPLPAGR